MTLRDLGSIMTAGKMRMAYDRHRKLPPAAIERALDSCPLAFVDSAQDAGIDREQSKVLGLQFEEHRPLGADIYAVESPQPRGFRHEPVDATRIGIGQSEIGLDTGFDCRTCRLNLEKVRVETFERIEQSWLPGIA